MDNLYRSMNEDYVGPKESKKINFSGKDLLSKINGMNEFQLGMALLGVLGCITLGIFYFTRSTTPPKEGPNVPLTTAPTQQVQGAADVVIPSQADQSGSNSVTGSYTSSYSIKATPTPTSAPAAPTATPTPGSSSPTSTPTPAPTDTPVPTPTNTPIPDTPTPTP